MDSPVLHIDLAVPQGWHELSDKQLRYAFELIASNYTSNEIKTLCLFSSTSTFNPPLSRHRPSGIGPGAGLVWKMQDYPA